MLGSLPAISSEILVLNGIAFAESNRGMQALANSPVPSSNRLQIGTKLTKGLGAGGDPDIGTVSGCVLLFWISLL